MKKKNYLILFLIIIGFVYVFLFNKLSIKIPCLFHKITGFYCPGCGITRMVVSLIHLEFKKAFNYNQLAFVLIPVFILFFIDYMFIKYRGKGFINTKIKTISWRIILVITILFGVMRNIPYFSFLRPL